MKIDFSDFDKLAKDLGIAPEILEREIRRTMGVSVSTVEAQVAKRTPVGATGQLRAGITTDIRGRRASIQGLVIAGGAGQIYGWPIEVGRRPGRMPPVSAIEYWVIRKGIAGPGEARRVAYVIARAIGRRGTRGVYMFEEGLDASQRKVLNYWQGLPERVIERVNA